MKQPSIRLASAVASLTWLAFGSAALAQSAAPADPLGHIPPHERQAYVRALAESQRAARLRVDAAVADATPPALTGFSASTTLNVSKADSKFKIAVKATDDMSGVYSMTFVATGPSGQTIAAVGYLGYPAKSVSVMAGFEVVNRFLEPGAWSFSYGYLYDVAGNVALLEQADFTTLGNASFTVVNNGGYDRTPPVLTGGKVITSAVSLASRQPGTSQDRYVGVSVSGTDAGNGELSGVGGASVAFCRLAAMDQCIYLSGNFSAAGQASGTWTAGAQVSSVNNAIGEYELESIYFFDWAGNYTFMKSNKFGGTVDFSTLFPNGTKITLNP